MLGCKEAKISLYVDIHKSYTMKSYIRRNYTNDTDLFSNINLFYYYLTSN